MSPKSLIIILGSAAFAACATPAFAKTTAPGNPPAKADSQVYCVKFEITIGSRIAKTECKTKEAWLRDGIDIEQEARRTAP